MNHDCIPWSASFALEKKKKEEKKVHHKAVHVLVKFPNVTNNRIFLCIVMQTSPQFRNVDETMLSDQDLYSIHTHYNTNYIL